MRLVPFAELFGLPIVSLYLKKGRFGNRNFKGLGGGFIHDALRGGNLGDNRDGGRIQDRHRGLPLHHPHLMTVGRGGFTGFTGERRLVGMQDVLLPTGRVVLDVFADAV